MNIGPHNYEAWLLDRMEGRLNAEQERALDQFLKSDPDLATERGTLPKVTGDSTTFPGKEGLKRTFPPTGLPNAARLNDFLVARMHHELDAMQEEALARYLYEHPECSRGAALLAMTEVPAVPVNFPDKVVLRRQFPPHGHPDAHRLDDFLVALLEGDLSAGQRKELESLVQRDPGVRRRFALLQATKVAAAPVHFPGKGELKKKKGRVVFLWPRLAAAASVLLVFGVGLWLQRPGNDRALVAEQPKTQVPAAAEVATTTVQRSSTPGAVNAGPGANEPGEPLLAAAPVTARTARAQTKRPEHAVADLAPDGPDTVEEASALALGTEGPGTAGVEPVEPSGQDEHAALAMHVHEAPVVAKLPAPETAQTLANMVREHILKQPARNNALDATDALVIADRTLNAVTKGEGGLDIQRRHGRERFKLRVGDNFSISASRSIR